MHAEIISIFHLYIICI